MQTIMNSLSFLEVREIQEAIVRQYEGEFGKHVNATRLPGIRMTWNAIPAQFVKENRKYLPIAETGRAVFSRNSLFVHNLKTKENCPSVTENQKRRQ